MKELCIKSVEQPMEIPTGFIKFKKGVEYDLDKIVFHPDKKKNEAIRDSVRAACFKKKATKQMIIKSREVK